MVITQISQLHLISSISRCVIVLPYAGGNCYSYSKMIDFLPAGINIICPELPGRGDMSDYPFIVDSELLAEHIFDCWIRPLHMIRDYVIYGHSMGALLTYLLAHKIRDSGMILPRRLIVSGRAGPPFLKDTDDIHTLPSHNFRKKIKFLGGMTDEILFDEDLMAYLEPILRSDIKCVETYKYVPKRQLEIPISVLYGSSENFTDHALQCWQDVTLKTIEIKSFDGSHFFIFEYARDIAAYLIRSFKYSNPLTR